MCINVKELEFDDYHSLLQWKSEEEKKSNTQYIKKCAPQTTGTIFIAIEQKTMCQNEKEYGKLSPKVRVT